MKYKESERVELKREIIDEIKKEIVAFLNTNGGTIYIGVNDDGTIYYNLTDKQKDIEATRIINWLINDVISPNPKDYIDLKWNSDGVLVLNICEGKEKPYYLTELGVKNGTYIRYETSKVKANTKEIESLALEARQICYEDLIASTNDLTFNYFNNKYSEFSDKYKALGFIKDNKYTNLAYLFSDNQNNRTKIYYLDNINNIKKRKDFKGPIIKQIDDILIYFKELANNYPYKALKEALLNAFIHRDWEPKSNIKIEINQNKINFISPGGLYLLSSEDIIVGKKSSRNPKLAKLLKYLGYTTNNLEHNGLNEINLAYKKYNKEALVMATSKLFIISLPKVKIA